MQFRSLPRLAALLAGAALLAPAQDVKASVIFDLWYTQMMDSNLRLNSTAGGYYPLRADFQENGFSIRRSEIYLSGSITKELTFLVMFDPKDRTDNQAPTWGATRLPNLLYDAIMTWKFAPGWEVKMGRTKAPTGYEASLQGSHQLYFYDRSILGRQFNDRRDQGAWIAYSGGDAKGFTYKPTLMLSNGSSDYDFGRGNDLNAQKDVTFRLEMGYGASHKFGAYYRDGVTDQADKGALRGATTWGGMTTPVPAAADVLSNKDKTNTMGAYYFFDSPKWRVGGEVTTGTLGRRYPSVQNTTAAFAAKREHLDQKFMGYYFDFVYKMGAHQLLLRYDFANYNSGDQWYGPYNPYKQNVTTGASTGNDYSPKFTEIVLGYNYLLKPSNFTHQSIKFNYILRSKNFLQPRAGQTGEQGGDSLVVAYQIGF
ncbi:MAG: hypothetical protein HY823_12490 [Acidobacteria bacterium]|nr:hypothetical protein [Acidobacteriota bacterium]